MIIITSDTISRRQVLLIEKDKNLFINSAKSSIRNVLLKEYKEFIHLVEKYNSLHVAMLLYELNYKESSLKDAVNKHIELSFKYSYSKFEEQYKKLKQVEDITLEQIIRNYIENVAGNRIKDIDATTLQSIKRAFDYLIFNKLSIYDSVKYLKQRFLLESDFRAERIARTEINAALNAGSYENAKNKGIELKKVWLAANDDRVRGLRANDKASHISLNGQEKAMNEAFIDPRSGHKLLYPGDVSLGATSHDVIHCRCTIIYKTI